MPYVILLLGIFIWRFYLKNDDSNSKDGSECGLVVRTAARMMFPEHYSCSAIANVPKNRLYFIKQLGKKT